MRGTMKQRHDSNIFIQQWKLFKYGLKLIEFKIYLIRQDEDLSDKLVELIYNYPKLISTIVKFKNSIIQKAEVIEQAML